jgi:hypothetical protein
MLVIHKPLHVTNIDHDSPSLQPVLRGLSDQRRPRSTRAKPNPLRLTSANSASGESKICLPCQVQDVLAVLASQGSGHIDVVAGFGTRRRRGDPGDLCLKLVEHAHLGRDSPENRIPSFPFVTDGTWDKQVAPYANHCRAVQPAAQFPGGYRFAENSFVHPAQQGGIVQIYPAIRLPEQPMRQLNDT